MVNATQWIEKGREATGQKGRGGMGLMVLLHDPIHARFHQFDNIRLL